jgi:hypothetical protein
MKEMYEQAVKDSENMTTKKEVGIRSEKAKSIKEKFERGEVLQDDDAEESIVKDDHSKKAVEEDMSVFEAGNCNLRFEVPILMIFRLVF